MVAFRASSAGGATKEECEAVACESALHSSLLDHEAALSVRVACLYSFAPPAPF